MKKSVYRPKLKLQQSNYEVVINIVSVLLIIILFSGLIRIYPDLPETIASHFNAKGEPDGYSGKSSVLVVAFVSLGIFLLITLVSRFPNLFNYPVKITDDNAERQYRLAKNYLATLKITILIIFAAIGWNIVFLSIDKSKTFLNGSSFLVFLLALIILPFVFYIVKARKTR